MTYRVLLVGGGTGGHIYPLVVVARKLQKQASEKGLNLELMAVADSSIWASEFENAGVKCKTILAPRLRKVEGGRINLLAFLKLPVALIQSLWVLFIFMPDLVFSKGGFASTIPSLVASLYFIPLYIHESDAIPGLTNRFLARFSKKIFVSFERAAGFFKNKQVVLSGNPVRENLSAGDRNQAAGYFKFKPDKKTVLFIGGSQGAAFINSLLMAGLVQLTREFQIIHQAGERNLEQVQKEVEKVKNEGAGSYGPGIEQNYRVYGFLAEEELKNAYALADVVVARAGANIIFEVAAAGKPAIAIPYKYSSQNHQKENAGEFAKFGAVVLEEQNLKPHILIDQIKHLINNPSVGQRIKQFAKMEAGEIIAEEIINVFRQ